MPEPLVLTLTGIALVGGYTLCYTLLCALAPFRRCARCQATGTHLPRRGRNRFGRARRCRRCHGTGRHVRTGRRAWTWYRTQHHDATAPATTTQVADRARNLTNTPH